MVAKAGKIIRLLEGSDKRFIIPVYQRPYSWKKNHCKQLFEDLMTAYEKKYSSHFFGSIVYVENDMGGSNEYIIIDGQQRLTTVSLLLLAIRNYIITNSLNIDGINHEKITKAYLTDEYAADEKKLKLKLVQGDDDAYDRLVEQGEPIADNYVTANYNYFYDEVSALSEEELKGIYDAIMGLTTVNVSLDPSTGDDPQLIFESLNSTGKDLEESDKIRNYVLMKLDSKRQERVYKKYWEILEKKITKDNLTGFIRHYLAVKTRELPTESRLYFVFKEYREQLASTSIEELLQDMLKYADYYQKIQNAKIFDGGYMEAIARLNKLDVNTVTPLLFDLFKAHEDSAVLSDADMLTAINIIEAFIIRRLVCGLQTAPLNRLFVYTGDEIEKYIKKDPSAKYLDVFAYALITKTGKSRFPNEHDFAEKFTSFELYNAKPSARKFIFERLENSKSKERVAVEEQLDSEELTIEHIMPQTLSNEWKKNLGSNWELVHTKYLHTIGNLTLTAYNSDYSNLSFEKKLEMPDKGIKCSKLELNESLKKQKRWDESTIKARATEMLGWAKKIWPVPVTAFQPEANEEWVSLDDDIDFTNMVISKMVLCGDEFLTDSITDAYRKFCVATYTLDPVAFSNSKDGYHSANSDDLNVPFGVGKGMYIETKLCSQAKVSVMKSIIKALGLSPSQDVKFLIHKKERFDIDDESTYEFATCGRLAQSIFTKLLTEHRLTEKDKEDLLDTAYCRATFDNIVYSALSLSKTASIGKGDRSRYYADPVSVDGVDYYISSQWYDASRESLINWYKKKMEIKNNTNGD